MITLARRSSDKKDAEAAMAAPDALLPLLSRLSEEPHREGREDIKKFTAPLHTFTRFM